MPAKNIPVRKRQVSKLQYEGGSNTIATLASAPNTAQMKKTAAGLKRSATEKRANPKVPMIKPNITAEVTEAMAPVGSCQSFCRVPMMALPANHSEVPANCEKMMMGRIRLGMEAVTEVFWLVRISNGKIWIIHE